MSNKYLSLYFRLRRELAHLQREADALSLELGIPTVDLARSVALHRLERGAT